jgi:hypothetical protein
LRTRCYLADIKRFTLTSACGSHDANQLAELDTGAAVVITFKKHFIAGALEVLVHILLVVLLSYLIVKTGS